MNKDALSFYIDKRHPAVDGRLYYVECDIAFVFVPSSEVQLAQSGTWPLVLNELQIEVDGSGRLLFVHGYCPRGNWSSCAVAPPERVVHASVRVAGAEMRPGVGVDVRRERWPVMRDPATGLICIGEPGLPGIMAIQFAGDSAVALRGRELVALWLRPNFVASVAEIPD